MASLSTRPCLATLRPRSCVARPPAPASGGTRQPPCSVRAESNDEALGSVSSSSCCNQDVSNRRQALLGFAAAASSFALATPQQAVAKLADYNPGSIDTPIEERSMQLGNADEELVFDPPNLEFVAGRIHKLKLSNPSSVTHYFTAFEFSAKVYTILVLAGSPAVEIKGAINELELKAGASVEWWFVPIKPGTYPLRCAKKGHEGMLGQLTIKRAA